MHQVAIADIRRIANLLLDHLESTRGPVDALEQDYFWSIGSGELRIIVGRACRDPIVSAIR